MVQGSGLVKRVPIVVKQADVGSVDLSPRSMGPIDSRSQSVNKSKEPENLSDSGFSDSSDPGLPNSPPVAKLSYNDAYSKFLSR